MSIFRKIKNHIETYFLALFLRIILPVILRFGSEPVKLGCRSILEEAVDRHQMTVEEFIALGYEDSSKANCLWEWKLIEVLDRFYKETSWIEVV